MHSTGDDVMSNEVKCWCRHCRKELDPSHTGPYPYCGKTGKDCKATFKDTVAIKASASATHKPQPSGKSHRQRKIRIIFLISPESPRRLGEYHQYSAAPIFIQHPTKQSATRYTEVTI